MMKTRNRDFFQYVVLHIIILIYSIAGIFSKYASKEPFFSIKFCLLYGGAILLLVIYAVLWQQILKKVPLTTAFCNKAITIVWSIIWGKLFFAEYIGLMRVCGAIAVLIGIILVVSDDE